MKSGKPIDISKSSLVSLKAELSKKQEEVQKAKSETPYVRPTSKLKILPKSNPGVEERSEKDVELTEAQVDQLKKSRDVLKLKAALYDKLEKGTLVQDEGMSEYLVDFKQKTATNSSKLVEEQNTEDDKSSNDENFSDDDNAWVEYTDCLGRTRKCLKGDLDSAKARDYSLATSLYGNLEKPPITPTAIGESPELELMSNDMHKEILRQKWEEQEKKLSGKKNVYYEDLRFDEARTHGVGYYQFSTEERKREAEQEEFKRFREETERRQEESRALRERRDRQKQARLIAARQRQRQRLRLPPIRVSEELEKIEVPEVEEEKTEERTKEMLETELRRAAHVRPWDVGKDQFQKQMSQEEWVDMKRSERPSEFAPSYEEDMRQIYGEDFVPSGVASSRKRLYKDEKVKQSAIPDEYGTAQPSTVERKGIEIPPPASFDYYTSNPPKRKTFDAERTMEEGLKLMREKAIEAGLQVLRERAEQEKITKEKELFDIM